MDFGKGSLETSLAEVFGWNLSANSCEQVGRVKRVSKQIGWISFDREKQLFEIIVQFTKWMIPPLRSK